MNRTELRHNAGFTLVEMLIVVAIIAILIAVSIPMVNSSLEAARDAADQSNERSAKAVMMMAYMGITNVYIPDEAGNMVEDENGLWRPTDGGSSYAYDAASGKLIEILNSRYSSQPVSPYGQCRAAHAAGDPFEAETDNTGHEGMVIWCLMKDGVVNCSWVKNFWRPTTS